MKEGERDRRRDPDRPQREPARRPVVPRAHRRRDRSDHHQRHGRAAPRDHRRPHAARVQGRVQRRQARGRVPRGITQDRQARGQVHQAVRRPRHVRPRLARDRPGEPGAGFVFENDIVGGVIPKEFISSIEKGVRDAMGRGVLAGYPGHRRQGVAVRRQLPRRRLFGSGVRGRGVDGASRTAPKRAGIHLLEPVMAVEVVVPEDYMGDVIGDLNVRRGRITGMNPRSNVQVVTAEVPLAHDVRLLDRPAQQDAGSRHVHDAVPPLRAGAQQHRRRDRRQGQGRAESARIRAS